MLVGKKTWDEPDLYLQTSWFTHSVCVYFISQSWICSYGSLKQSLYYHWKSKCELLTRSSLRSLPLHWSWPQSFQPLLQHVASSHSPLGSSTPRTTGTPPVLVYCSHQLGPSEQYHLYLVPTVDWALHVLLDDLMQVIKVFEHKLWIWRMIFHLVVWMGIHLHLRYGMKFELQSDNDWITNYASRELSCSVTYREKPCWSICCQVDRQCSGR